MKVYQENKGTVNGSIETTDVELLFAKAQNGLMELSISLGLEVIINSLHHQQKKESLRLTDDEYVMSFWARWGSRSRPNVMASTYARLSLCPTAKV